MAIKNRLKEIRMKEYMMQQNEFSKLLGINNKTYNQWESGKSYPKLEIALEIARKLNKSIDEIWSLD